MVKKKQQQQQQKQLITGAGRSGKSNGGRLVSQ